MLGGTIEAPSTCAAPASRDIWEGEIVAETGVDIGIAADCPLAAITIGCTGVTELRMPLSAFCFRPKRSRLSSASFTISGMPSQLGKGHVLCSALTARSAAPSSWKRMNAMLRI
ncbi:hypothetical protein ABL78_8426 [Leptomonas seymouri]|uniref:Uncharacterized protein n=1 Tax=Leptomonas seymouri TaxID=5684 RepID=A0A0N1PBR3_LEPSE|nr:hypothetical protein ABL78_8426 [Leptomonas seymouri]|eukprot:KPI82564.1 hypothetical protein ABL78_8426 [Leptomonas seymouri]